MNNNYKQLIENLLTDMNESESTVNQLSDNLDNNRLKITYKISQIINKIHYTTSKLNKDCRICGKPYKILDIHKYKELSTEELSKLLNVIENYLEETEDYTIDINIYYLLVVFIFSLIVPIYIAFYNMYLIQIFNYLVILFFIYPLIYTIYQNRCCKLHNKYFASYSIIDTFRLFLSGIKREPAINKHIWSCKYGNKLAKYVIEQTYNIQNKK